MREDPIITGGWIKAALVVLVAGALGVGAYLLASGVDINLPDLPDLVVPFKRAVYEQVVKEFATFAKR